MLGYKQYETRSWATKHRGALAIHASLGKPAEARYLCENNSYIREALAKHHLTFDTLPRGVVLGTCYVDECLNIVGKDSVIGLQRKDGLMIRQPGSLSQMEIAAGDYGEGRFAWELSWAREAATAVPCRGALSLWEVPAEVEAQLLCEKCGEELNPDAVHPCLCCSNCGLGPSRCDCSPNHNDYL